MPRVSKKFVDLNPSFRANPITGDVGVLKNEDAIRQSVKTLILTQFGEKPFQPLFGSTIGNALFENFDSISLDQLSAQISELLTQFEPRIQFNEIEGIYDESTNSVELNIKYTIIGIPLNQQSLNLILERV